MGESQLDATRSLPAMTWRGIEAPPYKSANVSGSHVQVELQYPYLPGVGHENTGSTPEKMDFNLFFINSLRPDMFPIKFNEWVEAFVNDGSPGKLRHPVLGEIDAVPLTWSIDVNSRSTSGVVMNVSFAKTIKDPADIQDLGVLGVSLNEAADAADLILGASDILDYPDGMGDTTFGEMMGQIEGTIHSASATARGYVEQARGHVESVTDVIDAAKGVVDVEDNWAARDTFVAFWNTLKDVEDTIGIKEGRSTAQGTVANNTTLDDLSVSTGVPVGDLIVLNPDMLKEPFIRAGSVYRYYTD